MAKNLVSDLEIKLGLKGMKALSELKSALRGIGSVAKVSTQDLLKVAEAVKKYSNKGRESVSVIKGQVSALKGLQEQAAFNSKAFRELGRDISLYEAKLKKAEKTAETSRAAIRRRGQFVKATPGRFLEREDFLRGKELEQPFDDQGKVNPAYIQQQAQLNILAEARLRIENRLAAAVARTTKVQVDSNKTLRNAAEIVKSYGAELNELPRTTNNLQMELRELKTDLGALVIGGEEYIQTLNRINDIQRQLAADPFDPTGRKAEIRSRLGTTSRFGGETDPVAKSIARNRRRRERNALPPLMLDQPREATGLFRTIASIGSAEAKAATEMMGRSLSQVTAEIKRQAAASNGSVNSLNAQKAAFAQLRAGLDPTSQDFRKLGIEIDKIDRKLSKLGKKKFSLKGAAQSVGAVASAGIFGGVAGAGGALAGSLFGPGGAVLGGGIGTTAGIAAQQISSFTDYAASISLAEKAMKRILEVEQDAVESARRNAIAQEAIEYAVSRLNVEREDATVGMTRLSAAVLGAGGNVETAALAFLGTTKAIKATKGSADDVRGGLTALVQMFSKGRISAEELSGQLGERFPAAVTAFAEANNISGAVLQKQLKDGKVGLDKLVNFLVFAVNKYSQGALDMAGSAEESGQRQKRAFDEVRRELGEQLINVGERLQEGVTDSLIALTPVIVNVAKGVASVVTVIIDGIVLVVKNIRNLIDAVMVLAGGAVLGALLTMITKVGTAMGAKGFAFSVALLGRFIRFKLVTSVGLLIAKLKALAITMAKNPITLLALGITALGVSMFRASQRHKDFIDDITSGVTSLDDAGKRLDKYKKRLEALNEIQAIADKNPAALASGLREASKTSRKQQLKGDAGRVQTLVESLNDPDLPIMSIGSSKALDEARAITANQASGIMAAMSAVSSSGEGGEGDDLMKRLLAAIGGNNFPDLEGLTGGDLKGKKDLTLDQLKAQKALLFEVKTLEDVQKKLAAEKAVINLEDLKTNEKALRVAQAEFQADQATARINEQMKSLHENILARRDKALLATKEISLEEFNRRELARQRVQLEAQLQPLLDNGKLTLEEINKIIDDIINGVKEGQDKGNGFVKGLRQIFEEAMNINKALGERGVKAVREFGDAFADFVVTGKANFREFAASVLQDLARIFAKFALFKSLSLIPGLENFLGFRNGGVVGVSAPAPDPLTQPGVMLAANGAVMARNRIVPYAKGGIVKKPTLFQYASGGSGRFGLMGEAGPEAIMPLRRGANGKLGVEASGGGVGNVVVNVDASGTQVQGNQTNANQLGKAIGAAVQAELIKQRRPGGLLTR